MAGSRRLVITLFLFFVVGLFVIVIIVLIQRIKTERAGGYNFEVRPAFRTGDNFPLLQNIFVQIEIGITFWA
jgi:hypothetical protein